MTGGQAPAAPAATSTRSLPPAQAEALSLRRALAEAQRKLHALSSDTGAMIDRRIVVKMLITYFEKDYSGGARCPLGSTVHARSLIFCSAVARRLLSGKAP